MKLFKASFVMMVVAISAAGNASAFTLPIDDMPSPIKLDGCSPVGPDPVDMFLKQVKKNFPDVLYSEIR